MKNAVMSMKRWKNWSGIVVAKPQSVVYASNIDEVVEAVKSCIHTGKYLRVVGSGHSFTPIAASDQLLLSLDRLQGLVHIDRSTNSVVVWGGTKLNLLGKLLHEHQYGQENLGDIDVQSIAGAISTGTHGTGKRLGNLSTQVIGLTIVNGKGEIAEYTEQSHPELFKALQISLGALGVIVQVKLRVEPVYLLGYESMRMKLKECLPQLSQLSAENRHFELYWFPYAETCQVKIMNKVTFSTPMSPVLDYMNDQLVENTLFGLLSSLCKFIPPLTKPVSKLSAALIPVTTKAEYSHRVFPTRRNVRFNEMEYSIPAEAMEQVIVEMRQLMDKENYAVHFPIECRYVAADDIWLSPSYGRDSAYIAVHMYKGMPYEKYFLDMEKIFLRYGGRPHWGKIHYLTASDFEQMYPYWNQFLHLQQELDPHQVFLSPYLKKLFYGAS